MQYEITNEKGQSLSIEGDTPPSAEDIKGLFDHAYPPSFMERHAAEISSAARPALELGGALAGGALGAGAGAVGGPLAVPGAAAGGALGFAGGKAAADLLDRGLGVKAPIPSLGAAAKETGSNIAEGAAVESAGAFAAPGSGHLLKQIGRGMLSGGTLSAVTQAMDQGRVEPAGVALSAAAGGVVPLIVPTIHTVGKVVKALSEEAAAAGSTLNREAIKELDKNPNLLTDYKGTTEEVGAKVKKIQEEFIQQHEDAGKALEEARGKIGFREPFQTVLNRVKQEGFKAPDIREVAVDYGILTPDKVPVSFVREARRIEVQRARLVTSDQGEQAMEYTKSFRNLPEKITTKDVVLPAKARLRDLIRLREKIDDFINYPRVSADVPQISSADQHFMKDMRARVNDVIGKLPGGQELRAADIAYSASRTLYDDFQRSLATEGKAEDIVKRILMSGDVEDVLGMKKAFVDMLRGVEKKTGQSLIEPAKQSLAAQSFNTITSRGYRGIPPRVLGSKGVADMLVGASKFQKGANAVAAPIDNSTPMRALLQAIMRGSK